MSVAEKTLPHAARNPVS